MYKVDKINCPKKVKQDTECRDSSVTCLEGLDVISGKLGVYSNDHIAIPLCCNESAKEQTLC